MRIVKLPGLIDSHVHLRTPGQEYKEEFFTGTSAALAGGYTTILDMPNNISLIDSAEKLSEKINLAKQNIVCDVGFHFGSLGDNREELGKVKDKVIGLKLYLSETTGGFVFDTGKLDEVFEAWPKEKVILVHAEGETLNLVISTMKQTHNTVHVCHVSKKSELEKIQDAKKQGLPITCGVTPHHLFLTQDYAEKLGPLGLMKPTLGTLEDQDYLWEHLNSIDLIESDHAPHTKEEKESNNPLYGVPGLETTLPLLLTACSQNKLSLDNIKRLCHNNPAKIFNIKTDPETYSEIDLDEEYEIKNENLKTKCGWSPFDAWRVQGKVKRVFIRGTKVFENGEILVKSGFGKVITPV